ncbi:MAG: V-type ATP synthase subunit E [Oscillospiraceae bacterium]|nr:V-type ATP synthase subunit E [Oscillospiraceae bacterium]
MKGTEKIIAHILADAKEQADAILAQAEQQCADIRAEYDAKAKEAYTERIRRGVADCQDRVDSMDRIARMEARKGILALKQQKVSDSFDLACEKIVNLPAEQYTAFLAKLAAKASVTGDEEIVLNAKDASAVGSAVVDGANALLGNGKLSLSKKTGSFAGGLILRRGSIEANCTAELLVELCRSEMSAQIAKLLFA